MQLNFYDTRITEDYHTMLVKEKSVHYEAEKMTLPKEFAEMIHKVLDIGKLGEEYCYMFALNTKNRVLGIFFLAKGTVNQCIVGIREVYMRALLIGASSIIFCHNHPSADCTPSSDDILLTRRLKEAGALMGIPLLDHIIIGGTDYCSFKEQEIL